MLPAKTSVVVPAALWPSPDAEAPDAELPDGDELEVLEVTRLLWVKQTVEGKLLLPLSTR